MYDNIASTYLTLLKEQREVPHKDSIHPMIDVDGIQRHRHNSEGKPIHPTEEGIKNFHRWFGDSMVTEDRQGSWQKNQQMRPLVLYHGTRHNFDQFRSHGKGNVSHTFGDYETDRHGIFLTPHREFANQFATQGDHESGQNVMPVYAKLHNYLDVTNGFDDEDIDHLVKHGISERLMRNIHPSAIWELFDGDDGKHFTDSVKSAGFDGVRMSEDDHDTGDARDVYVAFHPHQIKSAIGNKGNFSSEKNQIVESTNGHPMIDVDGVLKHRHNSEGKPIHHTDGGIRNFHQWFKNGVTDEHGRPQVFYHGTKHQDPIKTFQIGGLKNSELTGDAYGVGTYLTTSKGEASTYTVGRENTGGVYPLYAKGNILDIDAKELPLEHQKKLTDYANENLLPSDKSRFQSDSRKTAIFNQDELEDAKEFFDTHMKNYEYFGDGYDRNKPQVEQHGDKFHINYIDYNSPVKIKTGNDAHNLLRSVGFDNLKHAGFDGLSMNRQGGAKWLIMHSPDYNLKSAIGNKGTFNNISSQLSESVNHPMIDVNGEMKHRTNSSGKLIHYTDEGIRNFHRWFDNSSNVDEHGRPLVMYHGTGRDLTRFKRMSWVSHEPHLANEYADYRGAWSAGNPNVVPVYAKSNKPFHADVLPSGSVTIGQFFSELLKQSHPERSVELKAHMDLLKSGAREEESGPYYSAKDFWHEPNVHFGSDGENIIHNALKTAGFDSINYTEDGHKTIGLLRPNQLKSAIGNNGKFSAEKHEIVESKQGLHLIDSVLQQYDKPMSLDELAAKLTTINPSLFANVNAHDSLSRQLHRLNDWDGQNSKYKYATVNGKVTVELNPLYRGK